MPKKAKREVPQTLEEADRFVQEMRVIRHHLGELDELQERRTRRHIAAVLRHTQLAEAEIKKIAELRQPHEDRYHELFDGVQTFAEGNWDELTGGKSKTVHFPSGGRMFKRLNPKFIKTKGKISGIVSWLKEHDMSQYVRVKETLNKEALLENEEDVEKIPGVSVGQDEIFDIVLEDES